MIVYNDAQVKLFINMPEYKLGNEKLCRISDTAVVKLTDLLSKGNKFALRLKVIGGGCSGLQYKMDLIDFAGKGDIVVECDGARVAIDTSVVDRPIGRSCQDVACSGIGR